MSTLRFSIPVFLALFVFSACAGDEAAPGDDSAEPNVIEIAVHSDGYEPAEVQLSEGEMHRLVFTRKSESGCVDKVAFPDLDAPETELPLNEPVAVDLTPTSSGTFTFTCSMDMLEGTLMVES